MSKYICPECGHKMVWESRLLRMLVCENCGYRVNESDYGKSDDDDEYDDIWPPEDDDDDDSGEEYEEVYDELSHAMDD